MPGNRQNGRTVNPLSSFLISCPLLLIYPGGAIRGAAAARSFNKKPWVILNKSVSSDILFLV
jgi:hypothetical protein